MASDFLEDLGDATFLMRVQDMTLTPDFPEPGKEVRLEIAGDMREAVDLGTAYMYVTVKLGPVTLIRKSGEAAELLRDLGIEFGNGDFLPSGPVTLTATWDVPREIPDADFRMRMHAMAGDDRDIFLWRGHFDFRRR